MMAGGGKGGESLAVGQALLKVRAGIVVAGSSDNPSDSKLERPEEFICLLAAVVWPGSSGGRVKGWGVVGPKLIFEGN